MENTLKFSLVLLLLAFVVACSARQPAPVVDRSMDVGVQAPAQRTARSAAPRAVPDSSSYQVREGDTLYQVAFRYGLDYRDVARWNEIDPPYLIHPGDELRLKGPAAQLRPAKPRTTIAAAQTAGDSASSSPGQDNPPADSAATASTVRAPVAATDTATTPADQRGDSDTGVPVSDTSENKPSTTEQAVAAARQRAATSPRQGAVSASGWQWPASGGLVRGFKEGDSTRKGVDIAGTEGEQVVAARGGTVVYSGNGLIGYGELVIIKHDEEYLSAYGNNAKRLVAEKDTVEGGQPIASMGQASGRAPLLHFEIRRKGKPVNPAGLLPDR